MRLQPRQRTSPQLKTTPSLVATSECAPPAAKSTTRSRAKASTYTGLQLP